MATVICADGSDIASALSQPEEPGRITVTHRIPLVRRQMVYPPQDAGHITERERVVRPIHHPLLVNIAHEERERLLVVQNAVVVELVFDVVARWLFAGL